MAGKLARPDDHVNNFVCLIQDAERRAKGLAVVIGCCSALRRRIVEDPRRTAIRHSLLTQMPVKPTTQAETSAPIATYLRRT